MSAQLLIVMANDEAMSAVVALISELDVDVTRPRARSPLSLNMRSPRMACLSNLAESGRSDAEAVVAHETDAPRGRRNPRGAWLLAASKTPIKEGCCSSLRRWCRITSDENTNSLVIVATQDQFSILTTSDRPTRHPSEKVFVEAVVLEIASDDSFEAGIGAHMAKADGSVPVVSSQTSTSSSTSPDMLSGGLRRLR